MKIGFGFDAHELVENKPLKLGGVEIDFSKGLHGHSDGDVILHALSDAILGSCAAGDIGVHFRDDDKTIEGINSKRILEFSIGRAAMRNLRVHNIDIVVVADQPKLSGWYEAIRASISSMCQIPVDSVSVKAKTTEGTLVSRNAIACFATALMDES